MAHDAFISYATEDKAIADAVCAALEQHGIRCWIAPRDIRPGADWGESIVEGIKHARVLVLVFSADANLSTHIPREVERAVSHEIPIVPFRIQDVVPQGSLEYNLATVHWLDAMTPPVEAHIKRLADTLRSILNDGAATAPNRANVEQLPSHVSAVPAPWGPHGRPRWVAPVAGVVLVALIGLGGYLLLGPRRPPESPAGVAADKPAPAAPTPPTADVGKAPASPASPTGGRPTAAAGGAADPQREPFKQLALNQRQWFVCDTTFCGFSGLRSFFPAVTSIHFGEAANQLDRVIDLPQAAAVFDQRQMQDMAARYTLQYIPIRPGSNELYVRLEFYDGTISDVRPATIQSMPENRRTTGVRLKTAEAASGGPAPALFVGYTMGADKLLFTPDAPPDTTSVMYAFDEGGFARAPVLGGGARIKGFEFEGPTVDAGIQLRFILSDGTEHGPFRYALQGAVSLVLETFKTGLVADLDTAIHCTRVTVESPTASPTDPRAAVRAASHAQSLLSSKGLSFVTSAPVVACIPGRLMGRSDLSAWAAVREVRIGSASGKLDQQLPVQADWRDALARKLPPPQDAYRLWHALLDTSVDAVYAQLAFQDGTTSREIRLPIDELRLPAR